MSHRRMLGKFVDAGGLWTPAQVQEDLVYWYDISDSSTVTLSGSLITDVADKGNNSRDLVADTGKEPSLLSADQNGLDVGDWSAAVAGAVKRLRADFATVSQPITHASVFNFEDNSGSDVLFDSYDSSNRHVVRAPNPFFQADNSLSSALMDISSPAWAVLTAVANEASSLIRANGGDDSDSGNYGSFGLEGISIGSARGAPNPITQAATFVFSGKIGEMVGYAGTDSATYERLEGYLAWKWGLEGNLPTGHPYKLAAPTI